MSLKFVLLSTIRLRKLNAFELVREFDKIAGHFWQASHQQIYQQIKLMLADGSIEHDRELTSSEQPVYKLTASGELELLNWIRTPSPEPQINSPLLAKLSAGELADLTALVEQITQQRALNQQLYQVFKQVQQVRYGNVAELSTTDKLHYLALRRGLLIEKARMDWADESLELLALMQTEQASQQQADTI